MVRQEKSIVKDIVRLLDEAVSLGYDPQKIVLEARKEEMRISNRIDKIQNRG